MFRFRVLAIFFPLFLFSISGCGKPGDMVHVPEGKFIMGSDRIDTDAMGREFGMRKGRLYEDEYPKRMVYLKGFYMDRYEVTNREYKKFVDSANYNPPEPWENGAYPEKEADHPVVNVTWFDAHAFCKWAEKRLPTEEEWEKAARGPNGDIYPWGNEYDPKRANLEADSIAPVGSFEGDRSYYGAYDMAGNVMEWVDSWYGPYPGNTAGIKDYGSKYKVLRGDAMGQSGHYMMHNISARGSNRDYYFQDAAGEDGGFRCAKSEKE